MPQGQGTPGRAVKSTTVGSVGKVGIYQGDDGRRFQMVGSKRMWHVSCKVGGMLYQQSPASGCSLTAGYSPTHLDSVPAMHLVRASHANLTARLILYRLEQIRHAQEQRNAIPREKPQKTPNRQSFPTARKSHGTLIRRPLSVDTDTDRK